MDALNNNQKVLHALAQLNTGSGVNVINWFKESLKAKQDQMLDMNGNDLYRAAGAAKELSEILKEIEGANEITYARFRGEETNEISTK